MSEQGESRRRAPRRAVAVAVSLVAVVGAAGAGFAAGSLVGGGGTQPEDVLPATTVAYLDVDLDPAAEQKLNAVRLIGRLPDVEDEYGSEPDLRELVLKTVVSGSPLEDADVAAWMGDRLGIALVRDPASGSLTTVVACQVVDRGAAVDDLSGLVGADHVALSGDYVIVTGGSVDASLLPSGSGAEDPTQSAAEIAAAGDAEPLGEAMAFQTAFSQLEEGFVTFYVDGAAVADVSEDLGARSAGDSQQVLADAGQVAAVLRAEPDALEVVAWSSAALPSGAGKATLATGLPDDTVFAVEGTAGAELVASRWQAFVGTVAERAGSDDLDRALAQVEAQAGVRVPADLQTLAGSDVVVAVDGGSFLTGIPGAGVRSVTDPEAAADLAARLQPSLAELTGGFGVVAEPSDDGLVVATSEEYAQALKSGDGGLGASDRFRRALPDAAEASYIAWVDLAAVSGPLLLAAPEAAQTLAPLDSFGVTVGPRDDGTGVRVRVVFGEESE